MANDMLGRSPCRRIKLPEVTPVKRHIVSADELAGLAEAMGGVCAYGPMVYLGTVAGLRWGEVARLRVGQLDFEARTLAVTQTVVRGRGSAVAFGEPKSAASRPTLAVPLGLAGMLSEHIRARGLTVENGEALLFTSPDGGVLRYSNWLRRVWYPATVAAGLSRIVTDEATGRKRYVGLGFHDLRGANATGLVAEGVDVKTAQVVLGHSNPQLTLGLYARAVVSLGEAAAESMAVRFLAHQRAMNARWNPTSAGQTTTTRTVDGLSDLGGRGGTRTPDICLVSRVAEAAGCAARITTRATASVRSTSDHEPTRLASRSGTCVARASTACASCTPGRLSPSVSVLNVLVADSHPPVVVRCGSRRCRLVGLPCRLPSSLANRSPTPVRGPDTNHG
jgi:integrase